jgi:hypothetical protein
VIRYRKRRRANLLDPDQVGHAGKISGLPSSSRFRQRGNLSALSVSQE